MELRRIPYRLTVCKVTDISAIDMNTDLLKYIDESINSTLNNYPDMEFMSNEVYNEFKSFINILDEKFRQLKPVFYWPQITIPRLFFRRSRIWIVFLVIAIILLIVA